MSDYMYAMLGKQRQADLDREAAKRQLLTEARGQSKVSVITPEPRRGRSRNDCTSGKPDLQAFAIRYRLRHSPHSAFAATRPESMQKILESTRAVD